MIGKLARDEDGFATPLALIWSVLLLLIGGMAIDMTNAWRNWAMLQVIADSAAHAAALLMPPPAREITIEQKDAMVAEAIRMANAHLDTAQYGNVVTPATVDIGTWDHEAGIFTPDTDYPDAVRVTAHRVRANGNPVATLLLKLGVLNSWDVGATTIVQRFLPRCTRDGIISAKVSEITSNNALEPPFCLHGQLGVAMSSNNSFAPGVIVSMPDFSMLSLPMGGWESNVGLSEALATGHLYPRMINKIDLLFTELQNVRSPYQPDYIANGYGIKVEQTNTQFDSTKLSPGNVYVVGCGKITDSLNDAASNKMIKIAPTAVVDRNVIVTNCAVSISGGALIKDSMILTSNTSASSLSGSAEATIGAPDGCVAGGGAVLVTKGDLSFPSNAQFHEAQIIAADEVHISAAPGGITGIAIQAGGNVKLTASGGFALCPRPDDPPYMADYYRIVL